MRRGEVYRVALDPVIGSETEKTRPAVVVQNDLANRSSPTVTIIPISSRVARVYPFQVRIPEGERGLSRERKALFEQIRTRLPPAATGFRKKLDTDHPTARTTPLEPRQRLTGYLFARHRPQLRAQPRDA